VGLFAVQSIIEWISRIENGLTYWLTQAYFHARNFSVFKYDGKLQLCRYLSVSYSKPWCPKIWKKLKKCKRGKKGRRCRRKRRRRRMRYWTQSRRWLVFMWTLVDLLVVVVDGRSSFSQCWNYPKRTGGGSAAEIFEILPREWNLKPIFTQKWASADMNWGEGVQPPTPRQFRPWLLSCRWPYLPMFHPDGSWRRWLTMNQWLTVAIFSFLVEKNVFLAVVLHLGLKASASVLLIRVCPRQAEKNLAMSTLSFFVEYFVYR